MTPTALTLIDEIRDIDRIVLNTVVRRALGSATAVVYNWDVRSVTYIDPLANPGNGGLYRVSGTALDRGAERPWSVVLKALKSPAGTRMPNGYIIPAETPADLTRFAYWKREALAFETGLLDELPGGIAVPRCFGTTMRPGDMLWLWMEDIVDVSEQRWSSARYAEVARRLGLFNGAYLVRGALPTAEWMSPSWLRSWLSIPGAMVVESLQQMNLWEHPFTRQAFPVPVDARLMRLWNERERLLAALDRLPQTLCHLDAHRANLMFQRGADGQERPVAVDWAFVGAAGVGEELTALIVGSAMQGYIAVRELAALEQTAFAAYLEGLRAAGWQGDPQLIGVGYTASAALRYAFMAIADVLRSTFDAEQAANAERAQGRPFADILADRVALVYFLLDRADEAFALVEQASGSV